MSLPQDSDSPPDLEQSEHKKESPEQLHIGGAPEQSEHTKETAEQLNIGRALEQSEHTKETPEQLNIGITPEETESDSPPEQTDPSKEKTEQSVTAHQLETVITPEHPIKEMPEPSEPKETPGQPETGEITPELDLSPKQTESKETLDSLQKGKF